MKVFIGLKERSCFPQAAGKNNVKNPEFFTDIGKGEGSMKNILFFGLILSVLTLFTVFGCKTSEHVVEPASEPAKEPQIVHEVPVFVPFDIMTPLTPAILQRLRDSGEEMSIDERITKYQFRLVGRINLEREYIETNDGLEEGGAARFENTYIKENIVISDQTDGQAIALRMLLNELTLHLCFEDDDKYELVFVAVKDNPDGFFYLSYAPTAEGGEEKGSLAYGDHIYKIKFGDKVPHILIKLSKKDTDHVNSRTLKGRQVW